MLGMSGDGLITKLTSYLATDKITPPELPPPTSDQPGELYPTLVATISHDAETGCDDRTGTSARHFSKTSPRHSLKRSASELVVPSQMRNERLTATAAPNAVRFKEDKRRVAPTILSPTRTRLQPPRPSSHRSISNSRYELKSRYHDPAISSASLQKQLVEQTRPAINQPRKPSPVENEIIKIPRPEPTRSTAMRSNSEPDPAKAFANPKTRHCNVTLEPCIKKKAKSTTTTPPGELQQNAIDPEPKTLRRVKTVDFEENGSKPLLSLPQVTVTPERSTKALACDSKISVRPANNLPKTVKRYPSCPNTISIAKGTVAEPATTRTDVHVIAIAPSWNAEDLTNDDGADPATPTMQIIETNSGSYEVIWDDVPPEHSIRTRERRSSSASHALEAANPSAKRGLERVNSKLAGWSGTWNSPSDSFKPTIVVFPDDDGRAARYDCAVDEEEDLTAAVPPNSRMTSGTPSRIPSRPVSAPMTRTVSCEEISFRDALLETPPHTPGAGSTPLEQSLVVPSVEIRGRKTKPSAGARKLSNLEEADTKFRDHRDSVTIAHARNHAASAVRTLSRQKEVSVEALGIFTSEDIPAVTLPNVEEHAVQALRNSNSPSILQSPQQAPVKRHIRIVE